MSTMTEDKLTTLCVSSLTKVFPDAEPSERFDKASALMNETYSFQFLHWGYNFWFSQYAVKPIDPFQVTDAVFAFPSGDAFLVYPGTDSPIESIRLEVLTEALQDVRALQLLEGLIGRTRVLALVEQGIEQEITFDAYPQDSMWLLALRERINRSIAENIGG